jgi:hypothetical protein
MGRQDAGRDECLVMSLLFLTGIPATNDVCDKAALGATELRKAEPAIRCSFN